MEKTITNLKKANRQMNLKMKENSTNNKQIESTSKETQIHKKEDKNEDKKVDRKKISSSTPKVANKTSVKGKVEETTTKINNIKSKVLLLSDSHGGGVYSILNNLLTSSYCVQSIFKPNATFEQVTENVKELGRKFNKNDFIIIMAGVNNAIKGKSLNDEQLIRMFTELSHTNVICVSAPYWYGRKVLNHFIYKINNSIFNAIQNSNEQVLFLDSNSFLIKKNYNSNGLHLTRSGKFKLCKNIANVILNSNNLQTTSSNLLNCNDYIRFHNLIVIKPTYTNSGESTETGNHL